MSNVLNLEALGRRVAKTVGGMIPKGIGFAVVLFDFGPGGHLTYLSNGKREDVVRMLRELLPVVEHKAEAPPGMPHHPANQRQVS